MIRFHHSKIDGISSNGNDIFAEMLMRQWDFSIYERRYQPKHKRMRKLEENLIKIKSIQMY